VADQGKVVVLQPRRVAARATAAWMAVEHGWELGREIGYQVRFERRISRHSRIVVVTEGVLLRMLRDDPFLQDVVVVVFDEFHERNLDSDLALGMIRQVQQTVRQDLRIVVMSATLDPEPVCRYLDGCPSVSCEGRLFPVDVVYANPVQKQSIAERAANGVAQVLDRTPGDVLVFLPGLREIRQTRRLLDNVAREDVEILELYGDLPADRQDAVLGPCSHRKIVLATNVAETSLTIDGVTAVVDSGWARMLRYDPRVGLDRLELTPISKASADQRAGRAGRTRPGLCLRLWNELSHHARPDREEPEIHRADLSGAILQLLCWVEPDVERFPWFEPPREHAIELALALLQRLDAADNRGVTALGRRLAALPVHPRLGRLLTEGEQLGCPSNAALAAALLSERSPFMRAADGMGRARIADFHSRSDLLEEVAALEAWEQERHAGPLRDTINRTAAHFVFRVRDQLLREIGREEQRKQSRAPGAKHRSERVESRASRERSGDGEDEGLLRALLAAFPDRLAKRRERGSRRGLMVGGRGVRLADESRVLDGDLFLCLDVDDAGAEVLVRKASFVDRAWLPREHLTEEIEIVFEPTAERVVARRRLYWEDLLLEESPAALPAGERVSAALLAAAQQNWERVFPQDDVAVQGLLARALWLRQQCPESKLPALDDHALRDLLPVLSAGRRSFEELRKGPWLAALKGLFTFEQLQALDREAPERISVPSGRSVPLQYEAGKPPVLAVRIQEVFGLAETPRVARGRVPVLLHLLAPNMRVQQVTDDLRSFWANVYPVVRKELRGRYPKHAWPEDPWNARAERK
jgi:ATP-dependent helicase HrpB